MFTIQYQTVDGAHRMQSFPSTSRLKLVAYLAHFEQPIAAVYEQASPITKAVRNELRNWNGSKSRAAQDFVKSLP